MKDANITGTKSAAGPNADAPQAFRDMTEQGTAHAKESFEKMRTAMTDASGAMRDAYSSAAQGTMDCNAKIMEFTYGNINAAFEYANTLLGAKSPSEFIAVSNDHARKHFEVLSGQTKELTELGQKVMREAAEPLKAGAAKMFPVLGSTRA